MPLSEKEQRLLDEMERNLYRSDADFVSTTGGGHGIRPRSGRVVLGVIMTLAGTAVLVVGVAMQVAVVGLIVGVVGFAMMFSGVLMAVTPDPRLAAPDRRRRASDAALPHPSTGAHGADSPPSTLRAGSSFMDKINERWDRRQDGGQELARCPSPRSGVRFCAGHRGWFGVPGACVPEVTRTARLLPRGVPPGACVPEIAGRVIADSLSTRP